MNKFTLSLLLALGVSTMLPAQNTTTVTFKPNASVGEDALIWWTPNNCTLNYFLPQRNGSAQTQNFGDLPDLIIDHWTLNALGCSEGKRKVLIRFTELNNLPSNALITSAILKLHNPPQQYNGEPNSYYSGSPFTYSNAGSLAKILPGQSNNWSELTVNWDQAQQLSIAPNNEWVNIPNSSQAYGETLSLNVTNIIQQIKTDINNQLPFANNGFLLQLNNSEEIYRKWYFASSENPNAQYHPELVIEYTTEASCDANFSILFNTNNANTYDFEANEPSAQYEWTVNGAVISSNRSFSYTIKDDEASVCLKVTMPETKETCTKCTKIKNGTTNLSEINSDNFLGIYPNPSYDVWNIQLKNINYNNATYTLIDKLGRIIDHNIIKNYNGVIDNQNLAAGVYSLNINIDGYSITKKVIKY